MQKKQSTARELILFSMPLILSGILQQLYSWADAFIVGHAEGELPLAAVGATTSISMFLINTILGLTLGLSILGAQHYGRRDPSAVTRILSCFLPLIVLLYAVLSAAAYACASPILRLMDTPADIFAWSLDYLKIIFIGIPFLACYNLFAALLRAVGNTKAAFYSVLLSSVLNVALDVLFIVGFGWGVAGAAIATVLSQIAMTVFIVLYSMRRYECLVPFQEKKIFDRATFVQGLRFGIPPAIQNSVTSLGNLILQNFLNSFGSVTVLAITTAYRVDCMMLLPIINLGAAISSMTARAKGADDREKIQSCFSTGLAMMVAVSGVLTLVMFLLGAQFVSIFGVTGEALQIGRQFFRDLSVFYVLFGVGMVIRSVLEGAGDITCCSLIGMGMLGTRILFSYLLRPFIAGRTIAIAEGIAWTLMLLVLIWRMMVMHKRHTKTAVH